ncbi:MAG: 50S ribosomal protein L25 [Melioribacteraceae bacterium]
MANVNIISEEREISTKGAVNSLRKEGKVPGVLYSKGVEPISFTTTLIALRPIVYTKEMRLVNLKINDKEAITCILKDIQFDPVSDKIIHVDFLAITAGQKIEVQVPVSLIGQSVGIKEGGQIQQHLHKLEVECLPKNIPDHLEIDITELNIGDSVHIRDLSFDNITLTNTDDTLVVAIAAPKAEEEETATEEVVDGDDGEAPQPEVIGEKKEDEGSEG